MFFRTPHGNHNEQTEVKIPETSFKMQLSLTELRIRSSQAVTPILFTL